MICKNVRVTACAFALMLCVPVASYACEGPDCADGAKVKPVDVMQFMREQAASTRAGQRRHHVAKAVAAKPRPAPHRTAAAKPTPAATPAPLTTGAAASFASHSLASQQTQNEPPVRVLTQDAFNAIDSAAFAASSETTGGPPANDPNVQVVAEAELNDIDRKADLSERSPFPTVEVPIAAEPATPQAAPAPAAVSWLQWLWSAITGTFTALAAAVRQLVHV